MPCLASRLLLCLLAVCALPSLCAAQTQSSAPAVWKPDPKLLAQLGPEVTLGDYKIRPPKGYISLPIQHTVQQLNVITIYGWKGTVQNDGTSPAFYVLFAASPINLGPQALYSAMQVAKMPVVIYEPYAAYSARQRRLVNSISLALQAYQGCRPDTTAVHSIVYAKFVGRTVFVMPMQTTDKAQRDEFEEQSALPLMEAAALTFRKG